MSDRNRIREKRAMYAAMNYDPARHQPREKTPEELDRIAAAKARKHREDAQRRDRVIARAVRTPLVVPANLVLASLGFAALSRGRDRRRSKSR